MFNDKFYELKGIISIAVDMSLFVLWLSIEFVTGSNSDGYMFHETIPFGTLIIILIVIPIIINFLANHFTEKGKYVESEAKEISKQASKLRKEQIKEEEMQQKQIKEIKANEKKEQNEALSNRANLILDELKKKDIKYYKIICFNIERYFAYAWVEENYFNLLLDPKCCDNNDKNKYDKNGLINCNVKDVVLTDEYISTTSTTHTDAHVSVGGAIVGGMIGGTAGAILGGQKPATTKTTTESNIVYNLYLNGIKIELDVDSIPLIKDLVKDLKVIETINGKVYNEGDE